MMPYGEANLAWQPELVVVGNVHGKDHVEVLAAQARGIPLTSFPAVIGDQLLDGKHAIVVCGTHGKTTTTSLVAHVLTEAGHDPSLFVGGVPVTLGRGYRTGHGAEFVLEGDEYDTAFFDKGPKFLHYFPDAVLLTSVEFDHADIYKDLDAVKIAFKRLVNLVPQRGRIVAWDGQPEVDECVARAFCPVERYGFEESSHWRVSNVRYETDRTRWSVLREGKPWAEFEFALAGEYNVLNATAAAAMATAFGIDAAQIAEALRTFKSVKRRLEVKAEIGGVTVIDDFAHHPTAIAETLKALRTRYPGRRLWAVLEPRSNTLRRNVFHDTLAQSLSMADEVIVAAIFKSEAIPQAERLDLDEVVLAVRRRGTQARQLADADTIVAAILPEVRAGDVVAILSNGGFGGIYEKLPRALKSREVSAKA
jgi:UDP-N-acetylmuramate: L-alanyl-gamma-D-glutamyl-meso-diaminopimelate ligase